MQIFDSTTHFLERGLGVSLHRQVVLNTNVANVDTPGFTPRDVDFRTALANASEALSEANAPRATNPAHFGHGATDGIDSVPTYERPDTSAGLDGNRVDLDIQMGRLGQNAILYQATTKAVNRKLAMLRYAVTEGMG